MNKGYEPLIFPLMRRVSMKIALFSDIHGNADALEIALDSLRTYDCKTILIAGDSVGYYYEVDRVIKLLSEFDIHLVRGNHEEMLRNFVHFGEDPDVTKKYGTSLKLALRDLSKTDLDLLITSPLVLSLDFEGIAINISHGSPWKIDEYIYPDSDFEKLNKFLSYKEQYFVIGNTHHQMIRRYRGKVIINPGSIGQSRTDKNMVQWAELETQNRDIIFKSVPYDSSRLLKQILENDPENTLLRKFH